jgi:predicted ArsR family transcriptional regulator
MEEEQMSDENQVSQVVQVNQTSEQDKRFRVTPEAVLGSFSKKNGKTVSDLSETLKVTPATVRKYVRTLADQGKIKVEGARETGARGRPAALYVAA